MTVLCANNSQRTVGVKANRSFCIARKRRKKYLMIEAFLYAVLSYEGGVDEFTKKEVIIWLRIAKG